MRMYTGTRYWSMRICIPMAGAMTTRTIPTCTSLLSQGRTPMRTGMSLKSTVIRIFRTRITGTSIDRLFWDVFWNL